ncbi:MAG: nucleoside kinase [Bacteroidales bacterium]|nr:nucleoside kinase [Bacteroidales bacterium]
METIEIQCENTGTAVIVAAGRSLGEIAQDLGLKLRYPILGACVNNKSAGLDFRLYQPKQVKFFDITAPEGRRMYVRSLILMLYAAAAEVMPEAELEVLHSVSKGLYCELRGADGKVIDPTTKQTLALLERMRELQKSALPIERKEIPASEDVKKLGKTADTARLITQHGDMYTAVHTLNGHSAILFGELVPNTSVVDVFDLREYFSGMLLQVPDDKEPSKVAPMTVQNKMFGTFMEQDKLQNLMKVRRLADLNDAIVKGFGHEIIQVAEALHEKKIADIADMIAAKRDHVKVVLISGPSSSGKTTFSKRLAVQMILDGIKPINLSIDNYFVNRVDTPRDEDGKLDFEAVEAIDVKLFNEQLLALMDGKEVEIPKYNFIKGEREYDGTKLRIDDRSIIVIEGTHGLTPALTPMIPEANKFRIYVAPLAGINFDQLTRIHTTDNRLIRRIVRDYYTRGHNAESTIAMWPSVRRGEDLFIYTNQEEADVMFNSCTFYELAVLKAKAEPLLLEVKRNSPQYGEARRLLKFLSYFEPLDGDTIPPTSLLREFVGGSSFNYD